MKYILNEKLQVTLNRAPATLSSDASGTTLNLQGFQSALVFVTVGTITNGSNSNFYNIRLEHSDNGTSWSNVPLDEFLSGSKQSTSSKGFAEINSTSTDGRTFWASYIGGKQYLRIRFDEHGSNAAIAQVAAFSILGHAEHAPVNAPT